MASEVWGCSPLRGAPPWKKAQEIHCLVAKVNTITSEFLETSKEIGRETSTQLDNLLAGAATSLEWDEDALSTMAFCSQFLQSANVSDFDRNAVVLHTSHSYVIMEVYGCEFVKTVCEESGRKKPKHHTSN